MSGLELMVMFSHCTVSFTVNLYLNCIITIICSPVEMSCRHWRRVFMTNISVNYPLSSYFLQMEKAVELLDEMLLAGISPDEHTYTTIMHGYATVGDTGKAFEYFTKVKNEGLELDTFVYEALLKACCKSGRMQSALAVTKEMSAQKIPRNTFVYNILIDGYGMYLCMALIILPAYLFQRTYFHN